MTIAKPVMQMTLFLLGLLMLMPGCVVEPREGYYDHEHHRWWHEHGWHECDDMHCPH